MTPRDYYDPLESLDADLPYPEWMEQDLFDLTDDQDTLDQGFRP